MSFCNVIIHDLGQTANLSRSRGCRHNCPACCVVRNSLRLALVFIDKPVHTSMRPVFIVRVVRVEELDTRVQRQAAVYGVILDLPSTTPPVSIVEAIRLPTQDRGHRPYTPAKTHCSAVRMYLASSRSATSDASSRPNWGTGTARDLSVTIAINSSGAHANLPATACLKTSILGLSASL
jgi:hypothetical protein